MDDFFLYIKKIIKTAFFQLINLRYKNSYRSENFLKTNFQSYFKQKNKKVGRAFIQRLIYSYDDLSFSKHDFLFLEMKN